MTFKEQMDLAIALYKSGRAVILKDKDGRIVHGVEGENAVVIDGVDADQWKTTDWPEILRGARLVWVKNQSAKGQKP